MEGLNLKNLIEFTDYKDNKEKLVLRHLCEGEVDFKTIKDKTISEMVEKEYVRRLRLNNIFMIEELSKQKTSRNALFNVFVEMGIKTMNVNDFINKINNEKYDFLKNLEKILLDMSK
jgi:predicted transcriptional regulator